MFENPILMMLGASALLATPVASVITSVLTYRDDIIPTIPQPVEEYEKSKESPWVPILFGLGISYAICGVASFISISVLSYVMLPLPVISSLIGAMLARTFMTKKVNIAHAVFVGSIAGYVGLIASTMLGALGMNGHL